MSSYSKFTFDRSGQGLFYHGQIRLNASYTVDGSMRAAEKKFTVVYDCGTFKGIKGASQNLSKVVDRYHESADMANNRSIGLLAISHFDFDHVSHIPELLRYCKVENVMLPHIAEELRVVLLAKSISNSYEGDNSDNIEQGWNEELTRLFLDPIGYFSERGADQIIGVQGDDEPDDDNPNSDFPKDDKPFHLFKPHWDDSNITDGSERLHLRYVGDGKLQSSDEAHPPIYAVYSGSPAFRIQTNRSAWLFRPLNVQEKLPKSFYDEVKRVRMQHNNGWWTLLSTRTGINQLRDIYDLYIGKGRRNAHSLLLRHEPELRSSLTHNKIRCRNRKCKCMRYMECCEFHNYDCCNASATVLLGDLELDGNARAVIEKHRFLDYKTSVVLVPHHGAESDDIIWLDRKARDYDAYSVLVVSYGTNNTYGHPRFIFDGTMAHMRTFTAFANEDNEFRYGVIIHD